MRSGGRLPNSICVGDRLRDYLAYWLEVTRRRVRPSTYEAYDLQVRRLDPYLGTVQLGRVSPARVQSTYDRLLSVGLSCRSVEQVHAVLHRALDQAFHWGLIARNPTKLVAPPRPLRREMTALTCQELRALLDTTRDDHWHPLWAVLGTAGLRIGEALGLKWEDVDLSGRRIAIRRALQRQRDRGLVFVEPKTAKSRRTIHLTQLAAKVLKEHRDRQDAAASSTFGWEEHGLVFPSRFGKPLEPSAVTGALARALNAAGFPRIRVHDLRHTTASILLEAGTHPKIVQDLLGHSTVVLTLDTYSHLTASLSWQAAQTLDAMLAAK